MRRRTRKINLFRSSAARVALATLFSLALLSGVAPFASLAAGYFCPMPCCAGKAPHAADSYAGGSCHAHLAVKRRAAPETFRGINTRPSLIAQLRVEGCERDVVGAASRADDKSNADLTKDDDRNAPAETALLTHSCPPDCCMCASASAQLRRPHDSAALSGAGRARPPTPSSLALHAEAFTPASITRFKQSNPRAPPSLL